MAKLKNKIYTWLIVYALIVVVASIYHAFNFSDYIHTKGNETIYYVIIVLAGSVLFQVYVASQTPSIDKKAVIFGTIMVVVASIFFSFAIIMQTDLEGTPAEIILTFGACNLIFLSLSMVQQLARPAQK